MDQCDLKRKLRMIRDLREEIIKEQNKEYDNGNFNPNLLNLKNISSGEIKNWLDGVKSEDFKM